MDKLVGGLLIIWAVAMIVGIVIAIAPILLFIAGFALMFFVLAMIAKMIVG